MDQPVAHRVGHGVQGERVDGGGLPPRSGERRIDSEAVREDSVPARARGVSAQLLDRDVVYRRSACARLALQRVLRPPLRAIDLATRAHRKNTKGTKTGRL